VAGLKYSNVVVLCWHVITPGEVGLLYLFGGIVKNKPNGSSAMNNLKNLAGNDVSIFLFRFEIHGKAISCVINQEILTDMYEDLGEKVRPLAHACCETLSRYKHLSVSDTIMDGNVLDTGEFEVMLSKGLGKYFVENEKQQLFQDANRIADLLGEVMARRTKEEKAGKIHKPTYKNAPPTPKNINQGLEKLGHEKRLQDELRWAAEGPPLRPGLKQMRPEDLPPGVTSTRGYDHRGQCYEFEHDTLGELGRVVMIKVGEGQMRMQAELFTGQEDLGSPLVQTRKEVFAEVVATINDNFDENFPD
jgi:hypothetical protein